MNNKFGDWDIVSHQTNGRAFTLLFLVLTTILGEFLPPHSSVTWTLRHRTTGEMRRVTARSEREAIEKINAGYFDFEPRQVT